MREDFKTLAKIAFKLKDMWKVCCNKIYEISRVDTQQNVLVNNRVNAGVSIAVPKTATYDVVLQVYAGIRSSDSFLSRIYEYIQVNNVDVTVQLVSVSGDQSNYFGQNIMSYEIRLDLTQGDTLTVDHLYDWGTGADLAEVYWTELIIKEI